MQPKIIPQNRSRKILVHAKCDTFDLRFEIEENKVLRELIKIREQFLSTCMPDGENNAGFLHVETSIVS